MTALGLFYFVWLGFLFSAFVTGSFALYYALIIKRKPPGWHGRFHYLRSLPQLLKGEHGEYHRRLADVFWWWELRRVPYNASLAVLGLASSAFFWTGIAVAPPEWGWIELLTPAAWDEFLGGYIFLALVYAAGANLFYSAGWVLEGVIHEMSKRDTKRLGQAAFRAGWIFSAALTLAVPPFLLILLYIYK